MKLIIIAAVAENGCIGKSGKIPWHFSEDFKHFKKSTVGHTVVMGRKTFESIGNTPLPGRKNVVLSSTLLAHKGLVVVRNFEDVLKFNGDVYICGGSRLYKEFLPIADEMIITHVLGEYEGDAFFPMWPVDISWQEFFCEHGSKDDGLVYKKYRRSNNVRI